MSDLKRDLSEAVEAAFAALVIIDGQKATAGICGITRMSGTLGSFAMLKIALQSATQSLGRKSRLVNARM